MTAQAGWYNAPGESGTLRYWSGDAWTDYRQPVPASAPPVSETPVSLPPVVTAPALVAAGSPHRVDPYGHDPVGSPPQPLAPVAEPSRFAAGGAVNFGLNFDGIPIGRGSLAQLQELGVVSQGIQRAMREARASGRTQPRSSALKGALTGMLVGVVLIILGVALVLFFSAQNRVNPGDATAQGSVVDHSGFGSSCKPDVDFTVRGTSYQAVDGSGGSCSTDLIGDDVNVIYSVANPATTGRYDLGSPVESFDILLPLLGVVIFFSGLVSFIVRLFRRRSQLAQPAVAP